MKHSLALTTAPALDKQTVAAAPSERPCPSITKVKLCAAPPISWRRLAVSREQSRCCSILL